jgi:hypothetical protein
MQLLEGTEPEIESRKERLGLGSRTSRMASILTTAGSEVDVQPYSKVGLPGLKEIWTFSKEDPEESMELSTEGSQNEVRKTARSRKESREREEGSNGGSL